MRWRQGRRSSNIEDRRGQSGPGGLGSLVALAPLLLRSKTAWVALALLLLFYFFADNQQFLGGQAGSDGAGTANAEVVEFIAVILADTEDTWDKLFQTADARYVRPKLVLYDDIIRSACGTNSSAVGPFYCPADGKVYLDLDFLGELRKLGAPGDFAFAYVIAHEVGHHVQNLIGTSRKVQEARAQVDRATANRLSVMLELQADCFAGIWAFYAHRDRRMLEPGDLEEGLAAAAAVGDDMVQGRAGREVSPDAFTHGSAGQRMHWFKRGFTTGDVARCNTFAELAGQ
ncbi:KPN_02809 family neutral zinc metallopeptidase [Microbulbifer yueqingensis]|uniref:Metalloprotease n=1 Tax=Microbulbifer yueqingensis TaxID=658219 RepID=A0A1G8XC07_9GAMM|nr:neutral zinc metallopeptidase [Microbulbifer yueqingensis]SDJ88209.1 hypothetical protein SAMN05216212_1045 [Microbulbifer yueqingensis]